MSLRLLPMRTAINTWVAYSEGASEAKRALLRAASSLSPKLRALRRAFNSLMDTCMLRRSLLKGLASFWLRELRMGFNAWDEAARTVSMRLASMRMVAAAWLRQGVRTALNSWREVCVAHAEAQRRLLSAARAFRGEQVPKAFYHWMLHSASLRPCPRQSDDRRLPGSP